MKQIDHVTPDLLLSDNTAIIGSGARLNKSDHGKLIDTYADIIRFNRAPVEGYETKVGSKTTLRVVNNHVFDNVDASANGFTGQPQYFIRDLKDSRILYIAMDSGPWSARKENTDSSNELFRFAFDKFDELKEKYNYPVEFHVGLGIGAIFLCLNAGIKPHLFGFETLEKQPRDHYWEDRPKGSPCHDIDAECQIISKLVREDRVRLFK